MPTSPFTRFMAWIIVLGHAFVLFTPYDGIFEDLGNTWVLLFVLWIVLAVSVVRDTPSRDDLAFHRTLPPGAGAAFWRTVRVPLAILAGIGGVLLGYTWWFHFTAASFGRGLALLTLPAVGFLSACGVAASLASDRSVGKVRGWLAVFAPVAVSGLVLWLTMRSLPVTAEKYSPLRLTAVGILAAALCYPLIWWRVAMGKRLLWMVLLASVVGIGLPWLYGNHWPAKVKIPPYLRDRDFKEESILARRPNASGEIPGHLDSDVMEAKELKPGELASFLISANQPFEIEKMIFDSEHLIGVRRAGSTGTTGRFDLLHLQAGRFRDGSTGMGSDAELAAVGGLLPADVDLQNWDPASEHEHVELVPPLEHSQASDGGSLAVRKPWSEIDRQDWFALGSVTTLPEPLIFDLAKGGSAPSGRRGLIRMQALEKEGESFVLKVERFSDEGWSMDGPLDVVEQNSPGSAPYLVIVDEGERKAYLLNGTGEPSYSRVFLGSRQRIRFETGPLAKALPGSQERARRLGRLPGCKLYVFWPHEIRWFRRKMPAPVR
ncbi:MAG: hypothetical protein JWO82_2291 [Akkermansiaceae bacterium]|nr:hypothetical protein [Akkermansiaceae bacterium]